MEGTDLPQVAVVGAMATARTGGSKLVGSMSLSLVGAMVLLLLWLWLAGGLGAVLGLNPDTVHQRRL